MPAARGVAGDHPRKAQPVAATPLEEQAEDDTETVPSPALAELPTKPAFVDTAYHGPATVQVVPAGVSGQELAVSRAKALEPGSIWRRGRQRVRLLKVHKTKRRHLGPPIVTVEFQELSFGSRVRKLGSAAFLRSSWPVVDAGRDL